MTLKILQEVTQWQVPYRQPNHVYLMHGERVVAMSRWGEHAPEYFRNPGRLDRRGRKFIEVKQNPWQFDLTVTTDREPEPQGQTWSVTGSRGDVYTVSEIQGRWNCTCAGFGFRNRCRHLDEIRSKLPDTV